jgi:hypothetical protein
MRDDVSFPNGELDAVNLAATIQSAGWPLIQSRLRQRANMAVTRLRGGGKERHDYNAGYLQAIEDIMGLPKIWLEEAQQVIHHEMDSGTKERPTIASGAR